MSPEELRQMPSSLNDAIRKMELAADEIERLRTVLRTAKRHIIDLNKIRGLDVDATKYIDTALGTVQQSEERK